MYAQQIRDKLDPQHKGKFLVIDIETGDYEIDANDLVATQQSPNHSSQCGYLRSTDWLSSGLSYEIA